jgi:hypothetical protein
MIRAISRLERVAMANFHEQMGVTVPGTFQDSQREPVCRPCFQDMLIGKQSSRSTSRLINRPGKGGPDAAAYSAMIAKVLIQ